VVAKFNFELKIGGRGDIGWGNLKSEFKGWIVDLMTGPEILILDVVMLSSIFALSLTDLTTQFLGTRCVPLLHCAVCNQKCLQQPST
jgi:hypothetical protein